MKVLTGIMAVIGRGFFVSTGMKSYPRVVGGDTTQFPGGVIPAGTTLGAMTFRCPINYANDTDATCIAWYDTGDNIFLMLDYHTNVNKNVQLPVAWANKEITVVDKSTSFTTSATMIPATGLLPVVVTGGYGYAVLQLGNPPVMGQVFVN